LEDAASVLAYYHTIVHRWTPQLNINFPYTLKSLSPMYRRWRALRASGPADAFGYYFEMHRNVLLRAVERLQTWEGEANCGDLPVIAVHGDYHPGNLKFFGDKVVAVLDFDWSHMDHRVYDIGLAVFYCCVSWQEDSDGWVQLDRIRRFLGAYQRSAGQHSWVEPFLPEETACLPQMIQLANLFISDWTVQHYFTRGGTEEAHLRYLRHTVRVAEWLENHNQELVDALDAF
jgi:homoserine kinase type II